MGFSPFLRTSRLDARGAAFNFCWEVEFFASAGFGQTGNYRAQLDRFVI
jgi:hypothetical protein